jgi:hypothetical protein
VSRVVVEAAEVAEAAIVLQLSLMNLLAALKNRLSTQMTIFRFEEQ